MKCPFSGRPSTTPRGHRDHRRSAARRPRSACQEYTPWLDHPVRGLHRDRALLHPDLGGSPTSAIYVTPINIDPESPAMPISHPFVYSIYLAKMQGQVRHAGAGRGHLGAERARRRRGGLPQAGLADLRRAQEDALGRAREDQARLRHGRVRHDRPHQPHVLPDPRAGPSGQRGQGQSSATRTSSRSSTRKMDAFLGEFLAKKVGDDEDTVLMVISDHGFCSFHARRQPEHLAEGGGLPRPEGRRTRPPTTGSQHVDWEKTRAFTLGLTGHLRQPQGARGQGHRREGLRARRALPGDQGQARGSSRIPKTGQSASIKECLPDQRAARRVRTPTWLPSS